jgi:NCS1 family nucleobase:cation symporter-1
VLAGTVVDMSDPQVSLRALLPGWFYPVFLLVIVLGSITNNVLTAYSTGLALQAVGISWKRSVTVIFDAVVAVGITGYALFIANFLDALNSILELTVAFLGPALAIYGTDILLRRNRYSGAELHDETPRSRFWYWRGVNPAGAVAMITGSAVALLCANTDVFTGPVARALDGADLSAFAGPVAGAVIYAGMAACLQRGRVRDGQARDGRVRDGRVRDGRVRDGRVRDGRVRDGRVRDGRVLRLQVDVEGGARAQQVTGVTVDGPGDLAVPGPVDLGVIPVRRGEPAPLA